MRTPKLICEMVLVALASIGLAACNSPMPRDTYDKIRAEMKAEIDQMAQNKVAQSAQAEAVAKALLPPLTVAAPKPPQPKEERFSVSFNQIAAQQFFNAIVADTRYTALIHPDVAGTLSANLKDVTLFEALDAIREVYGYDYKVEGNRIYIKPLTLQTRVFQVNYLTAIRRGSSETSVTSSTVAQAGGGNNNGGGNNTGGNNSGNGDNANGGGSNSRAASSRISSASVSDFWGELKLSLEAIMGTNAGRSVVISPQSGVLVVRGMPDELRNVELYLKATKLAVERQVILEAKILEVQLNSDFQSGINWSAFNQAGSNHRFSTGLVGPGTEIAPLRNRTPSAMSGPTDSVFGTPGSSLGTPTGAAGALFGLAFQTSNFGALLSFLESQGTVHVLSSPRIATLNNQKAVLKIGTDEFFVTNVSTTTTPASGNTPAVITPSVTLQSFFSGVVLDVTPQIDEQNNITLHIHPQVSEVSTVNKRIDVGNAGVLNLPLASSNTSETDSVVRGQNGRVVAIGGLMRQATVSGRQQVPGAGDVPGVGALFRNTSQTTQKRELVILLKPTIIDTDGNQIQDLLEAGRRIDALAPKRE